MRDFQLPGRSAAYAQNGMAATSHPLATMAAVDVLRAGGNAVDAAVAAVAVQCVVEPQSTGIGGDCFALYAPASGGVIALNGSGRTPKAADLDRLNELGVASLANDSVHSITVPGAVRAWEALLEAHGTRGLDELLAPAIRHAEEGFTVTPRVAYDWARDADVLRGNPGGLAFYLPGGKAPPAGRIHRLPALGRTLRRIAEGGAAAFYEGELAASMLATLNGQGGLHTLEDFATAAPEFVEPISTTYRDVRVYECPPNGQGIVPLLMMNILEGYDLSALDPNGAERLHLEAEATRLAYRERDAHLADPAHVHVPTERLLDKHFARTLRETIDPARAGPASPSLLPPHPDTVYLTVVDKDRNAVSFINSLYHGFGSGLCCEETGVVFQNRGLGFSFDAAHPNVIAGGKRPMHTIIPAMAFKDGEVWMSFGVMGGQYQPVGHTHVLANMVDYGMDPQEALDAPRAMAYPRGLQLERGVRPEVVQALARMGHDVREADEPLGGGQAIQIDRRKGVLVGGSDPRKDGCALGY